VAGGCQQRQVGLSFPFAAGRKVSNDRGGVLAGLIACYGCLAVFPLRVFAAVAGMVLAGSGGRAWAGAVAGGQWA
jgi:hypothetical protein